MIFYYFATSTTSVITPPLQYGNNGAIVFRNVDTSQPLDVAYNNSSHGRGSSGSNATVKSITTVTDNAMVLAALALDDEEYEYDISAPPSGYTKGVHAFGNVAGSGASAMIAYKIRTSAGTESPGNFTNTSDAYDTFVFALRRA